MPTLALECKHPLVHHNLFLSFFRTNEKVIQCFNNLICFATANLLGVGIGMGRLVVNLLISSSSGRLPPSWYWAGGPPDPPSTDISLNNVILEQGHIHYTMGPYN